MYYRTIFAACFLGFAATAPVMAEPTLEQKLETLADEVELLKRGAGTTAPVSTKEMHQAAHGQAGYIASKGRAGETAIGGYGEMHYTGLNSTKELDLHRFILFMGHRFNDQISFFSELEVEHAKVDAAGGEVAIEQAFLDFSLSDTQSAKAGILLMPVGILNEVHEPPTFYGVERNPVEKNIIPTTWREAGAGLSGQLVPGLSYDLLLHSGFDVDATYAVRTGRQSGREAIAKNLAYTARLKWTGVPGLELATSLQQQTDITQGVDLTAGAATLIEAHGVYQRGPIALRALYASWSLQGTGPAAIGADRQTGYYVEPAYKITSKVGVFARYSNWNNLAGNAGGAATTQLSYGVNYWPHENVVLKFDIQDQTGSANDGINIGIGYQF